MVIRPMAALVLFGAAQTLSAESAPAWEKPPAIPAESETFADRVGDPQYHFILDGHQGALAGREFYLSQAEVGQFLWPTQPWSRFLPDRRWLQDSAAWTFAATAGNEVGDPLLNELASEEPSGNRTPFTAGGITWSPTGDWSVNASLDQNDHFSFRTLPARLALVGESRREELSWIGGNLPPKSLIQAGGALHRHGGLLAIQANRGWWWTSSPVSGMPYAWKGFNADFHTRSGDDFDLSLTDQSWESAAPGTFQSARWRRTEVSLGFAGGGPGGWRWRLELGGQRRSLYADSAFPTFQEDTYPWRFRYRQAWSPEGKSLFKLENQGSFGARDRVFAGQHATELRETWGGHQLSQGIKAYYRQAYSTYREPTEYLNPDSTWTAVLDPLQHVRGLSGSGEYRFKSRLFQGALSGHYAMEWGVPLFQGSVVDTLEGLLIRSGVLTGSEHHYANFGGKIQLGGALGKPVHWPHWRLQGGLRGAEGKDEARVEYRPSPWWVGGGFGFSLPSGLRAEALLHYLGPKEVRGWGGDFKVDEHMEANATLNQSLFDDRLELFAAFLHAFGDPVLEHPNGNPLAFRILAGMKGAF